MNTAKAVLKIAVILLVLSFATARAQVPTLESTRSIFPVPQ